MGGTMAFKIRTEGGDLYESAEKAYREHLSKFSKRNHTHLWRYFYWDFFHDGQIGDIVFRNGTDNLIIDITCPNIKRKTSGIDFEYTEVSFRCTFTDVVYYKFAKGRHSEDSNKPDSGPFNFLYSEINTLTEHIPPKTEDNFKEYQSLIVRVMCADGPGNSEYIELVFGEVWVEAHESTAFQLMLASSDFDVPLYNEIE
jgi:hypothetical protein